MPPQLHEKAKMLANAQGLSLNKYCCQQLERSMQAGEGATLVRSVRETWGDRFLGGILFGSTARGEARQGSDIDLLLVLKPEVELSRELYREWESRFPALKPEVSPQFVHLPRNAQDAGGIWFEVAIDGIVLWEENGKVTQTLIRLRESIARREVYRSMAHGHPYWIKAKVS